jgi:hypothetical protein
MLNVLIVCSKVPFRFFFRTYVRTWLNNWPIIAARPLLRPTTDYRTSDRQISEKRREGRDQKRSFGASAAPAPAPVTPEVAETLRLAPLGSSWLLVAHLAGKTRPPARPPARPLAEEMKAPGEDDHSSLDSKGDPRPRSAQEYDSASTGADQQAAGGGGNFQPLFRSTSFLERQAEKLGLDDEVAAQDHVAEQLKEKLERAEKLREDQLKKRSQSNADWLRHVDEVREAVKGRLENEKGMLKTKHHTKLATAQHRRRRSLDHIKQARQHYHHKVERRRSESLDLSQTETLESLNMIEHKLAMAERRRQEMREERRRRSFGRYEEAKLRYEGKVSTSLSAHGCGGGRARMETRQAIIKNRVDRKMRTWGALVIQNWWQAVRSGQRFRGIGLTVEDVDSPGNSPWMSPLPSPCLDVSFAPKARRGVKSPLGVDVEDDAASDGSAPSYPSFAHTDVGPGGRVFYTFHSRDEAARCIQSLFRHSLHTLKVANGLLRASDSIAALSDAVNSMSMASFEEAMDIMRHADLVSHTEHTLRSLRMGREIRQVASGVRSARAFLSCTLVNCYPNSALDDDGALSGEGSGSEELEAEKQRLVEASAVAVEALLALHGAVSLVKSQLPGESRVRSSPSLSPAAMSLLRAAAKQMVKARVNFCRRFDEWKRLDAARLAGEMTSACVDVLLMQLRAERDLHVAAARLGLGDLSAGDSGDAADDEGAALFGTGFAQIKEGTQRQLGRMMAALTRLVGKDEARRRMDDATELAFERLRADELSDDALYGGDLFADERLGMSTGMPDDYVVTRDGDAADDYEDDSGEVGTARPLTAGDLLGNEWLVHEVMISDGTPMNVSLEEALAHDLLRTGNTSVDSEEFWSWAGDAFAEGDYAPLVTLIADLRDKIVGLTPRRKDLAAETAEAMDIELLQQMNAHGVLSIDTFFKVIRFAGERVLELEAPVRNEETSAKLREFADHQSAIELGHKSLDVPLVRQCFEYLFAKADEIHVDILNAHLQFVIPFLKQHGVEYERDRFTEKLDSKECSLDVTHLWLHKAVEDLRKQAEEVVTDPTSKAATKIKEAKDLLEGLQQQRGDSYLRLLRSAMVDHLLGPIVRFSGEQRSISRSTSPSSPGSPSGDTDEDDSGLPVPETLLQDQYRLVVIAAGVEQVAYTAALLAYVRQVLAPLKLVLKHEDEVNILKSLMILFETDDVASADIVAQVVEMTRVIVFKATGATALPKPLSVLLNTKAQTVLSSGDCPVYKLWLKRTLEVVKRILISTTMNESGFQESLREAHLLYYKVIFPPAHSPCLIFLAEMYLLRSFQEFLMERVVRPLIILDRHNEAVFSPFYNEIIPLTLVTTDPVAAEAHEQTMYVD